MRLLFTYQNVLVQRNVFTNVLEVDSAQLCNKGISKGSWLRNRSCGLTDNSISCPQFFYFFSVEQAVLCDGSEDD